MGPRLRGLGVALYEYNSMTSEPAMPVWPASLSKSSQRV